MTAARDVMHKGATAVGERESLRTAAELMRRLDVGALPICGDDDRLVGIVTDRDIVVRCLALGRDPATMRVGELARGRPWTIDAGATIDEAVELMERHRIRRLPVIEDRRLVGMISEADISRHLSDDKIAHFVEAICSPA